MWATWEQLEGCQWVQHPSNDGDSFRVKTGNGRTFQFRLYFVDTPETAMFYPERVEAQARYFGVSRQTALRFGAVSSRFTQKFLSSGSFTVWTEWQDAWGGQKRYAALVYRGDESLIEALVAAGLVRVHGFHIQEPWPGGWRADAYLERLLKLEIVARKGGMGAWKYRGRDSSDDVANDSLPQPDRMITGELISEPEMIGDRMDLNTASLSQLKSLPGIGSVLAARIVNARPFDSVSALMKVKGVGPTLMDQLEPLLRVGETEAHIPLKTAAYYLENPIEWNGREIELSVGKLEIGAESAPEGFVRLIACTSFEGQSGGSIPLYLEQAIANEAMQSFGKFTRERILRVKFFQFEGEWVVWLRKG